MVLESYSRLNDINASDLEYDQLDYINSSMKYATSAKPYTYLDADIDNNRYRRGKLPRVIPNPPNILDKWCQGFEISKIFEGVP
jgi:hypothetical protein